MSTLSLNFEIIFRVFTVSLVALRSKRNIFLSLWWWAMNRSTRQTARVGGSTGWWGGSREGQNAGHAGWRLIDQWWPRQLHCARRWTRADWKAEGSEGSTNLPRAPSPVALRALSSSFVIFVEPCEAMLFRVSGVSPLVAISEFSIIPCFWE